ncbi:MAG: DNA polymerase II [Proteobacteria bacterium]|nr:MAG: DNA polymerase II [Pseudomonadota bacterium]
MRRGELAFLLTRDWRDARDGIELTFWARTAVDAVKVSITGERAVCFVERDAELPGKGYRRQQVALTNREGKPVDALYFTNQSALREFVSPPPIPGKRLLETGLRPVDRFLMERFIQGGVNIHGSARARDGYRWFVNPHLEAADFKPKLSVQSIDIETDFKTDELLSIGASGDGGERVFLRGAAMPDGAGDLPIVPCIDERTLLERFFDWLERADPDVLIGWNVTGFDLSVMERRCERLGIRLRLGRGGSAAHVIPARGQNSMAIARVPGRVVMDGIESLRAAFYNFESFALDHVAAELLGRGKLIETPDGGHRGEEIRRLHTADPAALARYNLEDCRLVAGIFAHTDLIHFAIERAATTGLALGRVGGSVAAFDFLYLPRLHRRGFVAPDPPLDTAGGLSSPGGYVLDSKPGLFDNVLVFDFKSLYPSIIRTFLIDPMGLWQPGGRRVEGFEGASFSRDDPILPSIIDRLWARRDEARRSGNAPLSQAVKIIMNSFYGVLGASACRFFDPRLTSSITRRGHEIIQRSRCFIEDLGLEVIYGDTDSLFVHLDGSPNEREAAEVGQSTASKLNAFWAGVIRREHDLDSHLEIEFETHYLKFLMPTVRGSGTGSKKRYAGLAQGADGGTSLVFKGLETVRTDWTRLAREFQHELFRRVFAGEPFEEYVREVHRALYDGELDRKLVYRKQLRQELERYRKNIPPHARAAQKLDKPGRFIEYVICPGGPEPAGPAAPRPDYEHYSERQLKPVADTILLAIGTSFDEIVGGQYQLFD